jgi:hypothetical protein
MLATAGKALLFTMKGTQEREWNTAPDRPFVRVAPDGKTGFAVVGRPGPFRVQVWPMDGGAARTFEVSRTAGPGTVSGGDFSVSEDGSVLLIGKSGLAVRVPAK